MKNLAGSLLLAVALMPGIVSADTSKNPDRFPSLGLDYTQTSVGFTGPLSEFYDSKDNTTTFGKGEGTLTLNQITIDFRAPVSNYVTLSVHGGPDSMTSFGGSQSGYSVGAGVRVYLPSLAN